MASIDDISKDSGSTGGGQLVTISGSGFDATPGKTNVFFGEEKCEIESIVNNAITCRTPPLSSGADNATFQTFYAGGAGLEYKIWYGTGDVDTSTGQDAIIAALATAFPMDLAVATSNGNNNGRGLRQQRR